MIFDIRLTTHLSLTFLHHYAYQCVYVYTFKESVYIDIVGHNCVSCLVENTLVSNALQYNCI